MKIISTNPIYASLKSPRNVKTSSANFLISFFLDQLFKKGLPPSAPCAGPARSASSQGVPGRRSAFYHDRSNPQRLRSARAVLEAWLNRAFHARFSAPIAPGPVLLSLPGTSPAAPDRRRSGRAPEKAYFAKRSRAARPQGKCCRSTPYRSACRPSSGALCAGEEGLPGDKAPISCHAPPVFIKIFTLSSFFLLKLLTPWTPR